MLTINFKNADHDFNYKVCSSLVGLPAFIDSDVFVSPVESDGTMTMIVGRENDSDYKLNIDLSKVER